MVQDVIASKKGDSGEPAFLQVFQQSITTFLPFGHRDFQFHPVLLNFSTGCIVAEAEDAGDRLNCREF
ncbi:MAG: hypothetical protein OXF63_05120 [Anaerolineaceae bacterium]|nr:hypothetical protein [Anaerolineaceae bacterium]